MATKVEVVYPSTSAFSGTSQLDLGPYFVPSVVKLLRCEAYAKLNVQGAVFGSSSVESNTSLWAVQWVPHTAAPADCVTTADGPNWLMRRQIADAQGTVAWAPDTANAAVLQTVLLEGCWAGQLVISGDIDIWFSMRSPTGAAVGNLNMFGSIRFWWN